MLPAGAVSASSQAAPNKVYVIDVATGDTLNTLNVSRYSFAQCVFANGFLFTANIGGTLTEYGLP